MMARFVTDQQLYQELKSPIMWWYKADNPRLNATVLWKTPRRIVAHIVNYGPYDFEDKEQLEKGDQSLRDVALMISGISLEVLFKSKIICDFSGPINETTFTQGIIKEGHDLVRLATKSRIRLDKEHFPVLEELTQYILWMGRYPIPKGERSFVYSKGSSLRQEGLWLTYNHIFRVLHRRTWRHKETGSEQT